MSLYELESDSFWSRNWEDEDEDEQTPVNETIFLNPLFMWGPLVIKEMPSLRPQFNLASKNCAITTLNASDYNQRLKTNLLIIGTYGASSCFLHCWFPDKHIIGSLLLPELSLKENRIHSNINNVECFLYKLNNIATETLVLLICQYPVGMERSFSWSKCLFQNILPERVVVFDRLPYRNFLPVNYGLSLVESPLLLKLETSREKKEQIGKNQICPHLEAPNLCDGLSAAVIAYCERRQIRAVLYLSLEDSSLLQSSTLSAFEPAIEEILLANPATYSVSPLICSTEKSSDSAHTRISLYANALRSLSSRKANPLFA